MSLAGFQVSTDGRFWVSPEDVYHRLTLVGLTGAIIQRRFIGVQCGKRVDVLADHLVDVLAGDFVHLHHAHLGNRITLGALKHSDYRKLLVTLTLATAIILAADVGFIALNNASQPRVAVVLEHRLADAMREMPRCFVRTDFQIAL